MGVSWTFLAGFALGLAVWLANTYRDVRSLRSTAGVDARVRVIAYRGLSHDGRRHLVVVELEAAAVAANPVLMQALMSAPPDGPAAPDHTVPLWQRNGGYEA